MCLATVFSFCGQSHVKKCYLFFLFGWLCFFFPGGWVGWSRIFTDIGNFWLILWVGINSHVQFWSFWGFVLVLLGFFCDNTSHVIWLKFLKWVNLGNMSTFTSSCCPKWQLKQRDCYRDEVIKKEKKKKKVLLHLEVWILTKNEHRGCMFFH